MSTTALACEHWYEIGCYTSHVLDWWMKWGLWIPRKLCGLLLDGLAEVIEGLPAVPGASLVSSNAGALSALSFWLHVLAIKEGVSILLAALIARWILRRLPVIG